MMHYLEFQNVSAAKKTKMHPKAKLSVTREIKSNVSMKGGVC